MGEEDEMEEIEEGKWKKSSLDSEGTSLSTSLK